MVSYFGSVCACVEEEEGDGVVNGGMGGVLWDLEVLGKGEGSDGLGRGWWWRVDRWMDGRKEGRKSEEGALFGGRG